MPYSCATDYFYDTDDPRTYIRSIMEAAWEFQKTLVVIEHNHFFK